MRGIIFFSFKIPSLSFNEKSPSGPIKTHSGFLFLRSIFLLFVFKSPKIMFTFWFDFKKVSSFVSLSKDGTFSLLVNDGATILGRIDSGNGRVRGEVSVGDEARSIYLRKSNLDPVNRYVNLSTRGFSSSGENVLIGGFVLAGTQPRTVLIRCLGPELENRGLVSISGEDAKDFLQNIITNDINKVSRSSSIFTALLSPQGKYLFDFLIIKHKNGYFLDLISLNQLKVSRSFFTYLFIGLIVFLTSFLEKLF